MGFSVENTVYSGPFRAWCLYTQICLSLSVKVTSRTGRSGLQANNNNKQNKPDSPNAERVVDTGAFLSEVMEKQIGLMMRFVSKKVIRFS